MARKDIKVRGIEEARRKLKDVHDNALRKRIIVSAAKYASKPVLKDMKNNISGKVKKGELLADKLIQKTIPKKYKGDENPGSWTGPKKSDIAIKTERGRALSIYWVEYGTDFRMQKSGRETGRFPKFAPLRNAILKNYRGAKASFEDSLIRAINNRIKRNAL